MQGFFPLKVSLIMPKSANPDQLLKGHFFTLKASIYTCFCAEPKTFLYEVSNLALEVPVFFYVEPGMGLRKPCTLNARFYFGRDH